LSTVRTDLRITMPNNVYISGLPIATGSYNDVLNDMGDRIAAGSTRNYISITNAESMYHAMRTQSQFDYIANADYSLCDGIGVTIAGLAWGVRAPRRTGPILMLKACDYGQEKNWSHYFYGGAEGVADLLESQLRELYPKLKVVGKCCPPFRTLTDDEMSTIKADIEAAQPDIIWVGLGLPKQEKWIAEWRNKLEVPWMIGVGAAFDYHSGTVSWAPKWMQAIGMEWLYRLILQPRLKAKRYYWSFYFLFESVIQAVRQKLRI